MRTRIATTASAFLLCTMIAAAQQASPMHEGHRDHLDTDDNGAVNRTEYRAFMTGRPPHTGIQPVELAGHIPEHLVDQRADGAQRMVGGHALLRRHITKHRIGLTIVSSHARHSSTRSMICRSLN